MSKEKPKEATPSPTGKHPSQTSSDTEHPAPKAPEGQEPLKQKTRSPSPVPEETEEEKANRKREELKRQLDAKATVPAKKKRKF
jgi:hypothetical protein